MDFLGKKNGRMPPPRRGGPRRPKKGSTSAMTNLLATIETAVAAEDDVPKDSGASDDGSSGSAARRPAVDADTVCGGGCGDPFPEPDSASFTAGPRSFKFLRNPRAEGGVVKFHKACLRCVDCGTKLHPKTFTVNSKSLLSCRSCFMKEYRKLGHSTASGRRGKSNVSSDDVAAKVRSAVGSARRSCAVCSQPVFLTELLRLDVGSSGEILLHNQCMKCKECGVKLGVGTFSSVRVADGWALFCGKHAKLEEERRLKATQDGFEADDMYSSFVKGKNATAAGEAHVQPSSQLGDASDAADAVDGDDDGDALAALDAEREAEARDRAARLQAALDDDLDLENLDLEDFSDYEETSEERREREELEAIEAEMARRGLEEAAAAAAAESD